MSLPLLDYAYLCVTLPLLLHGPVWRRQSDLGYTTRMAAGHTPCAESRSYDHAHGCCMRWHLWYDDPDLERVG